MSNKSASGINGVAVQISRTDGQRSRAYVGLMFRSAVLVFVASCLSSPADQDDTKIQESGSIGTDGSAIGSDGSGGGVCGWSPAAPSFSFETTTTSDGVVDVVPDDQFRRLLAWQTAMSVWADCALDNLH